jgi:hypothetical protein
MPLEIIHCKRMLTMQANALSTYWTLGAPKVAFTKREDVITNLERDKERIRIKSAMRSCAEHDYGCMTM